jgi:hypothetical protein
VTEQLVEIPQYSHEVMIIDGLTNTHRLAATIMTDANVQSNNGSSIWWTVKEISLGELALKTFS